MSKYTNCKEHKEMTGVPEATGLPELLEATKSLVELVDLWMNGIVKEAGITWQSPVDHPPALLAAREAIAKVEGKQE